jgi:hypothetical protein
VEKDKSTHHSALALADKEGFHQRIKMITPYSGETVFASSAGIEEMAIK